MSGIDLVSQVQARWPHIRCLMLSGHHGASYAKRAMDADAQGCVVKGNVTEIVTVIQSVLAGETYLSAVIR